MGNQLSTAIAMNLAGFSVSYSIKFGPLTIPDTLVRVSSRGTAFALQDLQPILPGHCVVIPKRRVSRLHDLTTDELQSLFACVARVQSSLIDGAADERQINPKTVLSGKKNDKVLEVETETEEDDEAFFIGEKEGDLNRTLEDTERTRVTAFNLCIKDGESTGQPVPHVHVHVVPRRAGDLPENDIVYGLIDEWSPEPDLVEPSLRPLPIPDDDSRLARTTEDMATEAEQYALHAASSYSPRTTLCGPLYDVSATGGARPGPNDEVYFGPQIRLDPSQVFWVSASGLTIALVNLKPLTRGHVLVLPSRREGKTTRLKDLSTAEFEDLWESVRHVSAIVTGYYGATGATLGIQDGHDAGQSVPHVHVHILPRGGPNEGEAAPGDCFPPPAPGART